MVTASPWILPFIGPQSERKANELINTRRETAAGARALILHATEHSEDKDGLVQKSGKWSRDMFRSSFQSGALQETIELGAPILPDLALLAANPLTTNPSNLRGFRPVGSVNLLTHKTTVVGSSDEDIAHHLTARDVEQGYHHYPTSPTSKPANRSTGAPWFAPMKALSISDDGPAPKRQREDDSEKTEVYFRFLPYKDLQSLRQALELYSEGNPRDYSWVKTLHVQILDQIEAGWTGQAWLGYAGETSRTALVRAKEDSKQPRAGRYCRWLKTHRELIARFPSAKFSVAVNVYSFNVGVMVDRFSIRSHRPIQELEKLMVAAISPALNSAPGGVHDFVSATHPSLTAFDSPPTFLSAPSSSAVDAVCNEHLRKLAADTLRVYADNPSAKSSSPMSATAQASTISTLACARKSITLGRPLLSMTLTSDITKEAYNAKEGSKLGFYDDHTGMGPNLIDSQRRLVIKAYDEPSAIVHGPTLDLFSGTLDKSTLALSLSLVSRIIRNLSPILLRVHCSRVGSLLADNALTLVFDPRPEFRSRCDEFFACSRPLPAADVVEIINPSFVGLRWDKCWNYQWQDLAGQPVIVQYGPKHDPMYSIMIANYHAGIVKYDSMVTAELRAVILTIAAITAVAEEVAHLHLQSHARPGPAEEVRSYLIALRGKMIDAIEHKGLRQQLEDDMAKYAETRAELNVERSRENEAMKRIIDQELSELEREKAGKAAAGDIAELKEAEEEDMELDVGCQHGVLASEIVMAQSTSYRASVTFRLEHSVTALGAKKSTTRIKQLDELVQLRDRMNSEGLLGISGLSPPLPSTLDSAGTKKWFLDVDEGANLFRSVSAVENHVTRGFDAEENKRYAISHFGKYATPGFVRKVNPHWSSSISISDCFKKLVNQTYMEKRETNTLYRLWTCTACSQSAITDENGKHSCPMRNDDDDDDDKRLGPTPQRNYRPIRYAHQLAEEQHVQRLVPDLDALLLSLDLTRMRSNPIVSGNLNLIGDLPFVDCHRRDNKGCLYVDGIRLPVETPDIIGYIEVSKNHPRVLLAAAVHQLLALSPGIDGNHALLPRPVNPLALSSPLSSGSALPPLIKGLKLKKTILQLGCRSDMPCWWDGLQSSDVKHHQHKCGTNMAEAERLAAMEGYVVTKTTAKCTHKFTEVGEAKLRALKPQPKPEDKRDASRPARWTIRSVIPNRKPPAGKVGYITIDDACKWYGLPITPQSEAVHTCYSFNDLPAEYKQRLWACFMWPGDTFYDKNDRTRGDNMVHTGGRGEERGGSAETTLKRGMLKWDSGQKRQGKLDMGGQKGSKAEKKGNISKAEKTVPKDSTHQTQLDFSGPSKTKKVDEKSGGRMSLRSGRHGEDVGEGSSKGEASTAARGGGLGTADDPDWVMDDSEGDSEGDAWEMEESD